ncbi:hypothetical protein [Roseiflexus sp.]|uniref:hypothetical protein n=1 Tax=Roseiflexus sp. TaxID=2562120 RepID=UPI0021DF3B5B|nr:hypothetical protein [Roseiflexus sp.]GIW00372.1 MAG: hypothetical protein KatS3mg058_1775 [Roseiflexus sp.]
MRPSRRNRSRRRRIPPQNGMQRQRASSLPTVSDRVLRWLLNHPSLDRLLTVALRYPRALVIAAIVIGATLTVWHMSALLHAPEAMPNLTRTTDVHALPSPTIATTPASDVVPFLAAYNRASALAAAQGQATLLAPYLAPDGSAWQSVVAEYARRANAGERRDATLVRWGILQSDMSSHGGWIETQEQWDVIVTVGGRIVSSRRGVLTHNRYWLRRDADGWRIVDATTLEVIR